MDTLRKYHSKVLLMITNNMFYGFVYNIIKIILTFFVCFFFFFFFNLKEMILVILCQQVLNYIFIYFHVSVCFIKNSSCLCNDNMQIK